MNSFTVAWNDVSPLIFPDRLERFEKTYGVVLPEPFKAFIKENNGGKPTPNGIRAETGEEFIVSSFLSFNREDERNVYKAMDYFARHYYAKFIPFAFAPSEGFYCLRGKRVVLFKQGDVVRICDDFSSFVDKIRKI